MLEVAELTSVVGDKPGVLDCAREEDATATKEAIGFLFKQVFPQIYKHYMLY
jgi:hypothetical protein